MVSVRPNSTEMPETVDQARDHVAALIVGAEPVVFEIAAALEALLLHHLLALRFGQHPGRLRRRRRRQVEIVRVVGIADQRPDDGAALVRDQLLQIGIAIVGGGLEVAAESGLGIADEGRPIEMAVELDQERTVVGDQLGKQRDHEQDQEDPERPVAAAVGFEVLPAAAVERRRREADGASSARPRRAATASWSRSAGARCMVIRLPAPRNRSADRSTCRRDRRSD